MTGNAKLGDFVEEAAGLAQAAHHLASLGLSPGSSGNASIRCGTRLLVTPTGIALGDVDEASLCLLDGETGEVLDGLRPTKEVPLHQAMYRRIPEAHAIVHLHSPFATAWSCRVVDDPESAIAPITPYFVMRVGRTPMLPYAAPGSSGLAEGVGAPAGRFHAALLQNHGSIVAKASMAEAVDAAVEIEATCRILITLGTTPYQALSEDQIADLRDRFPILW